MPNQANDNTIHDMDIDGSAFEGGGQLLRMAIGFAMLTKIPVRVYNIRAGRSKPGLSRQHLVGLEVAREMTYAELLGAKIGSTEVTFRPGALKHGSYKGDTKTAGSVGLIVQQLLPIAFFSPHPTNFQLTGGTNADFAPQIDYITTVFLAMLKRFDGDFKFRLLKRGYYPQGGGEIDIVVPPRVHLYPVEVLDPGKVTKIWGTAFTAGKARIEDSKTVAKVAVSYLKDAVPGVVPCIEVVMEDPRESVGTGSGIYIFAETTTGCLFGGTALGRPGLKPEEVGKNAAQELAQTILSNVCVDSHLQDQVIILMALAKGKSRILAGPITLHTETAIHVAHQMTKAKFEIHKQDGERNIIECEGMGLENERFGDGYVDDEL